MKEDAMEDPIYLAQQLKIETLTAENLELKRKLAVLKEHGVEIVDAVAGGYEVYIAKQNKLDEHQEPVNTMFPDCEIAANDIMQNPNECHKAILPRYFSQTIQYK